MGIMAFFLFSGLLDYSIQEMLPLYAAALVLAAGALIYTHQHSQRVLATALCLVAAIFLTASSRNNPLLKEPLEKATCLAKAYTK